MSILDRFRGSQIAALDETERTGYEHTIELLESDLRQLELALHEPGWQRLAAGLDHQFTRDGLRQIAQLCRYMRLKNPLLRRASALKVYYVWGQGIEVSAKDDTVADVIRQFVDDPQNQAALFGPAAREQKEQALHTDANVFLSVFTHPRTGRVQVRTVPFDQIQDVIRNPDDDAEPWFYLRRGWQTSHDPVTGQPKTVMVETLHPDIDYRPRVRPGTFGGFTIRWDAPILHVAVNRPDGWTFGVPELYPALDWARAHAEFLDDFRRIVKILNKFLWQTRTKGSNVDRAKTAMARATAEDAPVGQTYVADQGAGELSTVKTSGLAIEPADARQFALMVAAATDIPETMLLGDPSTGNLATATTLDRPTELAFETRRRLWTAVIKRLCDHAIDSAVLAPAGPLSGPVLRDEYGRQVIELAGETSRDLSVDWPPIQERSMAEVIAALVGSANGAISIPGMPVEELLRIALTVLDVDEPDEIIRDAMERLEAEQEAAADADVDARGELGETIRELREAIAAAVG